MNADSTETNATRRSDEPSPPVWFKAASIVALLWFLMDMSAFFMRVFMADDTIAAMPLVAILIGTGMIVLSKFALARTWLR